MRRPKCLIFSRVRRDNRRICGFVELGGDNIRREKPRLMVAINSARALQLSRARLPQVSRQTCLSTEGTGQKALGSLVTSAHSKRPTGLCASGASCAAGISSPNILTGNSSTSMQPSAAASLQRRHARQLPRIGAAHSGSVADVQRSSVGHGRARCDASGMIAQLLRAMRGGCAAAAGGCAAAASVESGRGNAAAISRSQARSCCTFGIVTYISGHTK
jgi:hypothetical protein